jgi:thioredoxin reductase (NADPH)
METTDTIIVGAGPIGIELAVALKRAGVEYVHLEAAQIGHTVGWYAPGTHFFSSPERIAIAGVPLLTSNQDKATREEYLAYLRLVVAQFDLEIRAFEAVVGVERVGAASDDGNAADGARFVVTTHRAAGGEPRRYGARNVVLAIGDMHRARRLGVAGEDLPHVSHYFGDPHEYFRRRVLIVGGRNSAVEAAIRLFRLGAEVAISYRGERFDPERIKYWLLPEINWLIDKSRIAYYPRTEPVVITPEVVALRSLEREDEPPRDVGADAVLLLTGYEQDPTLFESIGIDLVGPERAPRHDHVTMETNVPGVYVAGTATAGTQSRFRVFIETSHVHVARIVRAITGEGTGEGLETPRYAEPES